MARGPMQLHRLHLPCRFCCGFVNSPFTFITLLVAIYRMLLRYLLLYFS